MEPNSNSSLTRVVAVLGAAAIVVGVWYITSSRPESQSGNQSGEVVRTNENQEVIEAGTFQRDSDNDGLRDWEESLWGTEIETADTDGDGMPDGEEVNQNRDPLAAGPNDTLSADDTPAYTRDSSELTTSESFQRDFMERLAARNETNEVTEEEIQEIVLGLSDEYFSESAQVQEQYSSNDIQTSNSDTSSLRAYLNTVGDLALEYREVFSAEKLLVIRRVFGETTGEANEEAEALIDSFGDLEQELAALEVPSDLIDGHVNALNGIATMRSALEEVVATRDSDPLQSVIELNSFRSGFLAFDDSIARIQEYINESGMTFESDSSVSVFLSI